MMQPTTRDPDTAIEANEGREAPQSVVNFTFVNQADDLISLCRRRISNKDQRHTIRSHVMKRVRQTETAQGKKRLTGREQSKRTTKPKPVAKATEDVSPVSSDTKDHVDTESTASSSRNKLSLSRSPPRSPRLNVNPGAHEFDPFDTLPINQLPRQSSQSILQYCFDVMLPLTFSIETKNYKERVSRQGMILKSKVLNPAIFLGFLATTAAHRAVMYGRHKDLAPSAEDHDDLISDPDYIRVKHEATVAVRQLFEERTVVGERMLEACFGLVSTATVVGNFEEAKLHLQHLDRIHSHTELSDDTLKWLPLANVKVAVGLLQKPVMPLLLARIALPQDLLQQILSDDESSMASLGTEFSGLAQLSQALQVLLSTHVDICRLCEYKSANPDLKSPSIMSRLSNKATELEYDLVAYIYEDGMFLQNHVGEPELPAFEAVMRLAALGMLSVAPHTIMASTGNGRALTHHQKRALECWTFQRKKGNAEELRAVCWALFVFLKNATRQIEESCFRAKLSQVAQELQLTTWSDVEQVLYGYLYIPSMQSKIWKGIWADICTNRDPLETGHIIQ